jgi:formylglycine-generating enzyme required for sulfatase activity
MLLMNLLLLSSCVTPPQTVSIIETATSKPAVAPTLPEDGPGFSGMILIPEGTFTMGSEQATALAECDKYFSGCNHEEWYLNEGPIHEVALQSFYMDIYEVTNAQYQECVAASNCTFPGSSRSLTRAAYYDNPEFADYPVVWVTHEQAKTYCEWREARLPSEAEWEKAARGTDARLYPWGNSLESGEGNFCDVNCTLQWANTNFDDGFTDTSPVGSFPAGISPYGLYDMGGNVNEWIEDWYSADYYASSPRTDPTGPESGNSHVIRGGSFHTPGQGLRTTARPLSEPSAEHIGFRCAASAN